MSFPVIRFTVDPARLDVEGDVEHVVRAADERYEIVVDGLLFNGSELGAQPPTDSAQLLLSLYATKGRALLSELRGVFVLVIWDRQERSLIATRDPLGMHPLFYAWVGPELVLSWSIDALLEAGAAREVNRLFVAEHLLRRWRSAEETYFSAIRRVPAGQCLRVTNRTVVEPYWQLRPDTPPGVRDREAWLDEFEGRVEQAVGRCLGAGRAGVYLSGGVDSTTVTLAAARVSAGRGLPSPLALSVSFPDPAADETDEQRRVTAALGLPGWACSAEERGEKDATLLDSAVAAITHRAVPIGAPWDLAYEVLAREARARGCEVLLTGEGGDEWLALPHGYAEELLRRLELRRLGAFLSRAPSRGLWDSAVRPLLHRETRRFTHLAPSAYRRYRRARHPLPTWVGADEDLRRALREGLDQPLATGFAATARGSAIGHPLVSMYLEDSFALGRKFGIPLLHPLWDVDLVRFLSSTPPEVLELDGRPKGLAVAGVKRRLPSVGAAWPRRVTADAFLERVLREGLLPAWRAIGGCKALASLGVVDAARTERMIQTAGDGNSLPLRDAWAIVTSEAWLRPRIGDQGGVLWRE